VVMVEFSQLLEEREIFKRLPRVVRRESLGLKSLIILKPCGANHDVESSQLLLDEEISPNLCIFTELSRLRDLVQRPSILSSVDPLLGADCLHFINGHQAPASPDRTGDLHRWCSSVSGAWKNHQTPSLKYAGLGNCR